MIECGRCGFEELSWPSIQQETDNDEKHKPRYWNNNTVGRTHNNENQELKYLQILCGPKVHSFAKLWSFHNIFEGRGIEKSSHSWFSFKILGTLRNGPSRSGADANMDSLQNKPSVTDLVRLPAHGGKFSGEKRMLSTKKQYLVIPNNRWNIWRWISTV